MKTILPMDNIGAYIVKNMESTQQKTFIIKETGEKVTVIKNGIDTKTKIDE